MAWTNPMTAVAGVVLTAAQWNQYVRDNLNYLKGITDGVTFSAVQLSRVAATSIPDSTNTAITWTAEPFDFGGWWSSGTTITTPAGAIPAGYTSIAVMVTGRTQFASNATGNRTIRILKNGSVVAGPNVPGINGDITEHETQPCFFTVISGDTITMEVWQNSGGALNVGNTSITVARYAPAS